MKLRFFTISLIVAAFGAACATTDMNTNIRNSNATVRPTATPTATRTPLPANVSRGDYDKNRGEYERDKGASTIGQGIDDSWLWFKTKTALATTDDLRDSTINVDVVNDKITLKGSVATAAQKTRAGEVAKEIEGQKGVDNQLQVRAGDSVTNQVVNGNRATDRR